ncbi:hypothetical protein [Nocardioides palaemonis]|nr:hypothetical protein [Nocardioides palaemonis]
MTLTGYACVSARGEGPAARRELEYADRLLVFVGVCESKRVR